MRRFSIFLLLASLCFACSSEKVDPDLSDLGHSYFPLEKGAFRVYQINSVEYLLSGQNISNDYQLKEIVADTFQNLEGGTGYKIERYLRDSGEDQWILDSVWTARSNATQAILTEGNIPVLKLVFPLRENKTWDANALNSKEEDEYEMKDLHLPFPSEDSVAFERTVTVIQEEITNNILFSEVRKEVYGDSIGLVFKEIVDVEYCADEDCLGQSIIESGIEFRQHLIEYGKE